MYRLWSLAADYRRRLKLDKLAEQRLREAKLDGAIKTEDSGATSVGKMELFSLQIKKYQTLVVRGRLKRMSCKATNMAWELRVEELRHAVYRQIVSVTSPDGQVKL